MAIGFNTNALSMNPVQHLNQLQESMKSAYSKLSSGSSIPAAKDDAAGLAMAETLDALVQESQQGMNNIVYGMSVVDTADSAAQEVSNNLNRIRELSVQARNGTYNEHDRASMQAEIDQLTAEIDRTAQGTQFNGKNLLDGTYSEEIAVGAEDTITVSGGDLQAASLGVESLDVTTPEGAAAAIEAVDAAQNEVTSTRAGFGAASNQLQSAMKSLYNQYESQAKALSQIMDADYAKETADLVKAQIQQQAGLAVAGQANVSSSIVVDLLL